MFNRTWYILFFLGAFHEIRYITKCVFTCPVCPIYPGAKLLSCEMTLKKNNSFFFFFKLGVQLYSLWSCVELFWAESKHFGENDGWNGPRPCPKRIEEGQRSHRPSAVALHGKWKQYYPGHGEGNVPTCGCLDLGCRALWNKDWMEYCLDYMARSSPCLQYDDTWLKPKSDFTLFLQYVHPLILI